MASSKSESRSWPLRSWYGQRVQFVAGWVLAVAGPLYVLAELGSVQLGGAALAALPGLFVMVVALEGSDAYRVAGGCGRLILTPEQLEVPDVRSGRPLAFMLKELELRRLRIVSRVGFVPIRSIEVLCFEGPERSRSIASVLLPRPEQLEQIEAAIRALQAGRPLPELPGPDAAPDSIDRRLEAELGALD